MDDTMKITPPSSFSASGIEDCPELLTDTDRARLYEEFQPLVRRLIRQYGDTHEQRQDLEGEIYCRFSALLDEYDASRGIPIRAYLVSKLITSVFTFARGQWRRQSHEVSLEQRLEMGIEASDMPAGADPTTVWNRELMKEELLQAISAAIAQLPLRQRQVVVWRYYESRTFEDISVMLGICEATARSLLRHGMNNLRRKIAHTEFGPL